MASLKGNHAAVLGVYGGLDARINETRPAAQAALEAAHLKHELLTFAQADHAFFNHTNARASTPPPRPRRGGGAVDWFDHASDHRGHDR